MLVGLHVAGALKHHWIDRDNVLRAMLPFVRVAAQPAAPPAEPEPIPQAPKQETMP
jgi:cytochrome b561